MLDKLFGSAKPADGDKAAAPAAVVAKPRKTNLERRFSIIAEMGQGSMSRVFRATDNETGRSVCLKVQDAAKTAAAAARCAQGGRPSEGEIGMRIIDPHVVRTLEYGSSLKRESYIVMEFIDGVSLNFVRESRKLSLSEKLELLAQAAEGLAAVHAAGFIHHDFGPKNLLVSRDDRVKLIDFGLAVPNTPEFHRPGNRTGTLNYMAPELVRREPTDERLDVFSFGVTMFEFLTSRLPYDSTTSLANMLHRINSAPLDIAKANPTLPDDVCELCRKLMARIPKDRWATIATVASALRELPSLRSAARPTPKIEPTDQAALAAAPAGDSSADFLDMLGVAPAAEAANDAELLEAPAPAPTPEPAGSSPAYEAGEGHHPDNATAAQRPAKQPIPQDVRDAVWRRDRGRCVRCGGKQELKFKHVVPLSAGGHDTPDNLRLVCKPCRDVLRAKT